MHNLPERAAVQELGTGEEGLLHRNLRGYQTYIPLFSKPIPRDFRPPWTLAE